MSASSQGSVQVVIQQPPGRLVRFRPGGGGKGTGVLADQVVQFVPARCGLGDQVLVIQFIEAAPGRGQATAVERSRGVPV